MNLDKIISLTMGEPLVNAALHRLVYLTPKQPSAALLQVATDGLCFFYNSRYLEALPTDERRCTLLKSTLHAALLHPARMKEREPLRWSVAAELKANRFLSSHAVALPPGSLRGPEGQEGTIEEIYERLEDWEARYTLLEPCLVPATDPEEARRYWSRAACLVGLSGPLFAGLFDDERAWLEQQSSQQKPLVAAILSGQALDEPLPEELLTRYLLLFGLAGSAQTAKEGLAAFSWVASRASTDWTQLCGAELMKEMRQKGLQGQLALAVRKSPLLQGVFKTFQRLLGYP